MRGPQVKLERMTERRASLTERALLAAVCVVLKHENAPIVVGWTVIMGLAFLAVWGLS
jgi:hypothetical protein